MFGPPGRADVVLTFRNVHNWVMAGNRAGDVQGVLSLCCEPGGVLGVVEHRADDGASLAAVANSGYLPRSYVGEAGDRRWLSRCEESSDVNANPNDTHDHPKGVWTLPPTLDPGRQGRAKYQAIGESDRMTLRFVKPGGGEADSL